MMAANLGLGVPPPGGAGEASYADFSPISDDGDPGSSSPSFGSSDPSGTLSFPSGAGFLAPVLPPVVDPALSTFSSVYTPHTNRNGAPESLSFSPSLSAPPWQASSALLNRPPAFLDAQTAPGVSSSSFSSLSSFSSPPSYAAKGNSLLTGVSPLVHAANTDRRVDTTASLGSSLPSLSSLSGLPSSPQSSLSSLSPLPPRSSAAGADGAFDAASVGSCLASLREQFGRQKTQEKRGSVSERGPVEAATHLDAEEAFPEKSIRQQLRRLDNRQVAIEMLANFLLPFAGPESERLVHIFAEEMQRPSVPAVSRLAIFYLFHHLLHQPVAAPSPLPPPALEHGNAARLPPQGSRRFGDIGFYAFLVPFMKTLPQFPPLLTEKVLRCCCIFAERGFYTHEAVRHLFAFVPPGGLALPSPLHEIHPLLSSLLHPSRCTRGTSATLSLHAEPSRSAVAACRALSLPALKCLLRMPSVTKGIAHARSKLQELPFNSSLSSSDVSSLLPLPSSAPSSSFSLSPPPPLLSAALFAGMPVNQLTECSAALDRATRLTGQEYILLQSSLLDLSSLLQCMHEDFVGLRASISSLTSSLTEEVSPSKRRRQSQAVGPRERATEERENDEKSKQAKHGEGKPTKGAERRDRGSGNDKSHRS